VTLAKVSAGAVSPARLIALARADGFRSQDCKVLRGACDLILKLGRETDRARFVRESYDGGTVEMLVQSIDAHLADEDRLRWVLFFVANVIATGESFPEPDTAAGRSLAREAKGRALAAGLIERLVAVLAHASAKTGPDALMALSNATSGCGTAAEDRRAAAARAGGLEGTIAAMRRFPESAVLQHAAIMCMSTIYATGCNPGEPVDTSRADEAVHLGGHTLIIKAIVRFRMQQVVQGHVMYSAISQTGKERITMGLPGSILEAGCHALYVLAQNDTGGRRAAARNAAGALNATATALRANPGRRASLGDSGIVEPPSLEKSGIVERILEALIDKTKPFSEQMGKKDDATFRGFLDRACAALDAAESKS
jgi:hypothetical protein